MNVGDLKEARSGEDRRAHFAAISKARKDSPVHDGFMMYFADAMMEVAKFSKVNNDKHNPGQQVHWSKHKSKDHADCVGRHLIDIGPEWDGIDEESGMYHACALAWRSFAILQMILEAKRLGMKPRAYIDKLVADAAKPAEACQRTIPGGGFAEVSFCSKPKGHDGGCM